MTKDSEAQERSECLHVEAIAYETDGEIWVTCPACGTKMHVDKWVVTQKINAGIYVEPDCELCDHKDECYPEDER